MDDIFEKRKFAILVLGVNALRYTLVTAWGICVCVRVSVCCECVSACIYLLVYTNSVSLMWKNRCFEHLSLAEVAPAFFIHRIFIV